MHAWNRHDNTWLAMLTILLINIEGTCKTGTTCWRLQNWQGQIEPRVDRDSVQQAAETMCSLRITGKFCFRTEKKSANIYASACSVDWNSWKPRIFYRSFNRVDLSLYIASRAEPLVFIWSADDLDRGKDFGGHSLSIYKLQSTMRS